MKNKPARLYGRLKKVSDVSSSNLEEMFSIFSRYYLNVTREAFLQDFADKSHVIILRERRTKTIRGFMTLKTFETSVEGRAVVGLFSGDTVIEREFWGQSALRSAFCRLLISTWWKNLLATAGRRPCYWFLISKGYKTYLLLTNNFPTHWPRYDSQVPEFEGAVIRSFAEYLYPGRLETRVLATGGESVSEAWVEACVLPFSQGAPCLREGVAPIRDELRENPNIRFFEQANPGWRQGHELCCLAPIGPEIFLRFVKKASFAMAKYLYGVTASRLSQPGRREMRPLSAEGELR